MWLNDEGQRRAAVADQRGREGDSETGYVCRPAVVTDVPDADIDLDRALAVLSAVRTHLAHLAVKSTSGHGT